MTRSTFLTRPDIRGTFGASASTHWLATGTAQSVLERGGNAFDAAVAAAFVLHVVEPHLNGPGGDLVALIAPAGERPRVLCGQGPAPAGATIEHYRAEGLATVPGAGALAAAVPGAVDAWLLLLRDHGTWSLGDVLEYAIEYSGQGHPFLGSAAATIGAVRELFAEHWPTSAGLWLPGGAPPAAGERFANPAHAATLRRLRDEAGDLVARQAGAGTRGADREATIEAARTIWRNGFVARAIEEFVAATPHRHSQGGLHRGVLTAADMADWSATYEEPVAVDFRGRRVYAAGPWSQGPVLLQTLAILEGYADEELDLGTTAGVHRAVEAMKLAMADREAYYGEGLPPAALATLLSPEYAATRRALIGESASHELRPGTAEALPSPYTPVLALSGGELEASAGEPTVRSDGETRGDTCHLDVVDRWGNMIAATPSGGWLQSSPTIPQLGFCLGTRLQMSHLDPASPSALQPGRRPRTTLTPTMVVDAHGMIGLGTPGGDQQAQWQLVSLLRALVMGQSPQASIDGACFHTTSFPGSFWPRTWEPGGLVAEDRLGEDVLADLAARGHVLTRAGDWSLGRLSMVGRETASGIVTAAANPRGAQGYAAGR